MLGHFLPALFKSFLKKILPHTFVLSVPGNVSTYLIPYFKCFICLWHEIHVQYNQGSSNSSVPISFQTAAWEFVWGNSSDHKCGKLRNTFYNYFLQLQPLSITQQRQNMGLLGKMLLLLLSLLKLFNFFWRFCN